MGKPQETEKQDGMQGFVGKAKRGVIDYGFIETNTVILREKFDGAEALLFADYANVVATDRFG